MNSSLIKQLKVNQWKNTQNVIEWFMKIEEKSKQKFIVFDIKRLPINTGNTTYQSNKLWRKTCKDKDKIIIEHSRKSLLQDNSEPWMKKDTGLFDITIGAQDEVEVCELVRTFLLYKLSLKYNTNSIGL